MSEADYEPMERPGDEWIFERTDMSKKYSTEELVDYLEKSAGWNFGPGSPSDAIIAKLGAADKLCEASGKMLNGYRDAPYELAWDLRRAIADYEGKE